MKNPHKLVCNFYISKNKVRFWVRDNMHSRPSDISHQGDGGQILIKALSQKPYKTP